MGKAVRQNPQGDLIGRMNVGDLTDRQTRVYETNAYLPYHTDPTDVVGLLCIRRAKSGGISSLVSSASLYNESRILNICHVSTVQCSIRISAVTARSVTGVQLPQGAADLSLFAAISGAWP